MRCTNGANSTDNDADERQPRKESVTGSENFRRVGGQRIADWTHSCENHRRIQERIDPAQMSKDMVAKNPDSKSTDHNSKRHQSVSPKAPEKFGRAQKRLCSMLVHVCGGLCYRPTSSR